MPLPWIVPIFGSSGAWALADVCNDICIKEHHEPNNVVVDLGDDNDDEEAEKLVLGHSNVDDAAAPGGEKLNGDRMNAVSGLVTIVLVYVMCATRWTSHVALSREFSNRAVQVGSSGVGGIWSPFRDSEWWMAALGGVLMFYHYQTLLWAYDFAPSTVINPLLQVSSTWVLVATSVVHFMSGSKSQGHGSGSISAFELFCYVIIVVGGLLPSIGQSEGLSLWSKKFWSQKFVRYAVLTEVCMGMYDLLLAKVLKMSEVLVRRHPKYAGQLEMEFFFVAWCWFVVFFAIVFSSNGRLRFEYDMLFAKTSKFVLGIAVLSQILNLFGYYCSQYGYSWFYATSVVHAAEASLSQAVNLIVAFVAYRKFKLGRASAVTNMRYKMASVVVVSVGLFLISVKDVS